MTRHFAQSSGNNGHHVIIDMFDCAAEPLAMPEAMLKDLLFQHATETGLTVVGAAFHQFSPHGVTGVLLLAESHVAIHTWPEHGYVSLDIFVCNMSGNHNRQANILVAALQDVFQPADTVEQSIVRPTSRAVYFQSEYELGKPAD